MKAVKDKILLITLVIICICGKNLRAQSFTFIKPVFKLQVPLVMPHLTNNHFSTATERITFQFDHRLNSTKKDYINTLPIFCKMEELIFRQSGMNLRINLGSNDDVRKLEGKF